MTLTSRLQFSIFPDLLFAPHSLVLPYSHTYSHQLVSVRPSDYLQKPRII